MAYFKTMRCRYFDERGKPLKPYCIKGDHCSFIHPNDSNWATGAINKVSATYSSKKPPRRSSPGREPNRSDTRARRASPLPEQATLFKRVASEEEVVSGRLSYDREPSREPDGRLSQSKSYYRDKPVTRSPPSRPEDRVRVFKDSTLIRVKSSSDHGSRGREDRKRESHHQSHRPEARTKDYIDLSARSRNSTTNAVDAHVEEKKSVEGIVQLFRNVAKLTNRATLDTAAYDKEDEKLHTYTELSNTLAQISPSAAVTVAPALDTVIANHAKYRERVQDDFKRLSHAWEDIFELFVHGVVLAIDARMESTLARLRDEVDVRLAESMAHTSSVPRDHSSPDISLGSKRKREDHEDPRCGQPPQGGDEAYKRRRILGPLVIPDASASRVGTSSHSAAPISTPGRQDIHRSGPRGRIDSHQSTESYFTSASSDAPGHR